MAKSTMNNELVANQTSGWNTALASALAKDTALVVGASALMAVCAHVSLPLVFSPVPLTLQTFGVLLIGFALGSKRGFAALALYLLEGAAGLPVFSPTGPGGIAQIVGPTGGFLMAYPVAAFLAGWLFEQHLSRKKVAGTGMGAFAAAILAAVVAEGVLFSSGMAWLKVITGVSFAKAATLTVAPFIPGEVLKIAASAAIASRLRRASSPSSRQQISEV